MTISFWNYCPKHPSKVFLIPNLGILIFFHEILQLDKFEGADFKYDNSFLKFQPENNQIRHFCSQVLAFSISHDIFQLDKFKGADFKYDNSCFKFQPKILKYGIFSPNLRIFIFAPNFATTQIRGCWFEIRQ